MFIPNKPLEIADAWRIPKFTKDSIVKYLTESMESADLHWSTEHFADISHIRLAVAQAIVKPKIAVVGMSDVGKSTLINDLLGSEKMPTSWTPTTSTKVYIKHIHDRPAFIQDDCWIFRCGTSSRDEWLDYRLSDEDYCEKWKIAGGSINLLNEYGTRQGEHDTLEPIGSAVVFIDSDILLNCDLIDLPGFGTGDRRSDDEMSGGISEQADIIIYMSHAQQFLNGPAISFLNQVFSTLKPLENRKANNLKSLCNLYVLASHAHTVEHGNPDTLNMILDKGCDRLVQTIPDSSIEYREKLTNIPLNQKDIRARFFPYAVDMERLKKSFLEDLRALIESLPAIINNEAIKEIKGIVSELGEKAKANISRFERLSQKREKLQKEYDSLVKQEPDRKEKTDEMRQNVISRIHELAKISREQMKNKYEETFNADHIAELIKDRGFKNNKEGRADICSYISALLQEQVRIIATENSDKFSKAVDEYLAEFENTVFSDFETGYKFDFSGFDVKRVFAAGFTGVVTLGALMVWASTFGNLGAYILLAKGVSILSALGISVGGTAAAASAVAAIGGPIVFGIALAIIGGIVAFNIFSGSWRKSLGKAIVKQLDEKNTLRSCQDTLDKYWKETEDGFNSVAENLERSWKDHIKTLGADLQNLDMHDIIARISEETSFINFIQGIPSL